MVQLAPLGSVKRFSALFHSCICSGLDGGLCLNPSRITLDPIHVKNEGYCWLQEAESAGSRDPGGLWSGGLFPERA